jgi:ferritin-like metal-binding protein YciE
MAETTRKDAKLIQYLNEAYGKEKELETALQAHIGMTTRAPYKKRLQQHLGETKAHSRALERRVKQLGGRADWPGPDAVGEAATAVQSVASKAMAAARGPLHALRGTGEQEKMLKNAKTEYWSEHEEIATYRAIETVAESVGDRDTVKLARDHRREEERMANFLERQIPQLAKAVVQAEIPASERRTDGRGRRRRRSGGRSRTTASSTRRSGSSSRSGSSGSSRRSGSSSRSGSSGRSSSRSSSSTRRSAAGRSSGRRSSQGGGRS